VTVTLMRVKEGKRGLENDVVLGIAELQ